MSRRTSRRAGAPSALSQAGAALSTRAYAGNRNWKREFGVVKKPQTRPWQIPTFETGGGWEHLVGLSADEICWQLENPDKDVRAEINAQLWAREKTKRELHRRVDQWPETSVQRRIETRQFRETQRSRGSNALRNAGNARLRLKKDLHDVDDLVSGRSSSDGTGTTDVGERHGDGDATSTPNRRRHPARYTDEIYFSAFQAPDPNADTVQEREGRLCQLCGVVIQRAVFAKHLEACSKTKRHLRTEPWKDRESIWVTCPHCHEDFREALFRKHIEKCSLRHRVRTKTVTRFASEEEQRLYREDRDVYNQAEQLKVQLVQAVADRDMARVKDLQWQLYELNDRRAHLHKLGDLEAARISAEANAKAVREKEQREAKARRKRILMLRRPKRASIEIQRWARGYLVRKKMQQMAQLWKAVALDDEARALESMAQRGIAGSQVLLPRKRPKGSGVLIFNEGSPEHAAVIRLQAYARRLAGQRILWRHRAATKLARFYRRTIILRKWMGTLFKAQAKISSSLRMMLQRRKFVSEYRVHRSAVKIQAAFRALRWRRVVRRVRQRVILIQAWVRTYQLRCRLDKQNFAAYQIQGWYRYFKAMRVQLRIAAGFKQVGRWFRRLGLQARALTAHKKGAISDDLFSSLTRHKRRTAREMTRSGKEGNGGGSAMASSVIGLMNSHYKRARMGTTSATDSVSGEGQVDKMRVLRNMKLLHEHRKVQQREALNAARHLPLDRREPQVDQGSARLGLRLPEPIDTDVPRATTRQAPGSAAKRLQKAAKRVKTAKEVFDSIGQWFRDLGDKMKVKPAPTAKVAPVVALAAAAAAAASKQQLPPPDSLDPALATTADRQHIRENGVSNAGRSIAEVEHRRSAAARTRRERRVRGTRTATTSTSTSTSAVSRLGTESKQPSTDSKHRDPKNSTRDPEFPFGHPTKLYDGWAKYVDPSSGKAFYFHEQNDDVTWTRPEPQSSVSTGHFTSRNDDTWSRASRSAPRGFGRHQLNMQHSELDALEDEITQRRNQPRSGRPKPVIGAPKVAPMSSLLPQDPKSSQSGGGSPSKRKFQKAVKRQLSSNTKMSFHDAVKLKGLGRAIDELPSSIKIRKAFQKLGMILARPFSKDKYFRNKGKMVDRRKARHGPAV